MKDAQHEQREMQIKTILRHHPTPVGMAIIKKPTSSKCWRGCGEENPPVLLGARVEPLWETEWIFYKNLGFPHSSVGKESACKEGDLGLIPGLGRSPGEGKGYPLQDSDVEQSTDYTVHGVAKSQTRLSDFHFFFT